MAKLRSKPKFVKILKSSKDSEKQANNTKIETDEEQAKVILKNLCSTHCKPYTKDLEDKFFLFIEERKKLSNFNSNNLKVYAYAFVYNFYDFKKSKRSFINDLKLPIFENALNEVKAWNSQVKECLITEKETKIICNLYSMKYKVHDL